MINCVLCPARGISERLWKVSSGEANEDGSFGFVVLNGQMLIAENADPDVYFWLGETVQIMKDLC